MSKVALTDILRYVKYPRTKGMVIFLNDRFNYHLREEMVKQITLTHLNGLTTATVTLDNTLPIDEQRYRGSLRVSYKRVEVSGLFRNGIVISDNVEISKITPEMISRRFSENLGLNVPVTDFDIIQEDGTYKVRFNNTSAFWVGDLTMRRMEDPKSPVGNLT